MVCTYNQLHVSLAASFTVPRTPGIVNCSLLQWTPFYLFYVCVKELKVGLLLTIHYKSCLSAIPYWMYHMEGDSREKQQQYFSVKDSQEQIYLRPFHFPMTVKPGFLMLDNAQWQLLMELAVMSSLNVWQGFDFNFFSRLYCCHN